MDDKKDLVSKIKDAGVFDSDWYLNEYPDVRRLGLDPIEHFVRWGWKLGRQPSATVSGESSGKGAASGRLPAQDLSELLRSTNAETTARTNGPGARPPLRLNQPGTTETQRKLPLTALVIAWDVGHNPLGRAYMLAEVLDRVVRKVVLTGFQFPRYGNAVWEPVRDGSLPVIALPAANFPQILDTWDRICDRITPDVVFACKPRLPSLQLAAMIRQRARCPLILDIDDHELSFFGDAPQLGTAHLESFEPGSDLSLEPYERIWTQLAHGLRGSADHVIVSNAALQREFGGTIVPHVRDEATFDPSLYDQKASREKYGVPASAKVTLFLGTPRAHKGIHALAEAIGRLSDPLHRLVVAGTATDKRDTAKLHELAPGRVILLPNQPFAAIPQVVSIADVVCLPQDPSSLVSRYQLPAKAIDAIAMNVPLLVVPTEPMEQLIADGLAKPVDPQRLAEEIETATYRQSRHRSESARRQVFLSRYSHAAAAQTLRNIVERVCEKRISGVDLPLQELLRHQRRLTGLMRRGKSGTATQSGKCVVLFWKQNDTTLYGRRHDMVIKYLASRADIRKVIVFDSPVSEHDLLARRRRVHEPTQDRQVYVRTYQKLLGVLDSNKISYNVFLHRPGTYRLDAPTGSPNSLTTGFLSYVDGVLGREHVDAAQSIFWIYPKNQHLGPLIDHFRPAHVVVDVVDDHRTWPGVTEPERDRLTEHYRDILGRATMAIANCEPVRDAMGAFSPGMRLVPNGCDDRMPTAPPVGHAGYDALCTFQGKVIGFVGNLEKKIDIVLIEKIANRFPDSLVLLLGSTHANPDVLRLQRCSNVRFTGVVPYEEVGAWISKFHVGIIPHLNSDQTRSMNPLKLYVYLSLGVPVVSTEIFNLDRSSNVVRIGRTHEEFLAAVAESLEGGQVEPGVLDAYVKVNNWESRFRSHVDELLCPVRDSRILATRTQSEPSA